jgi:hypothetical protein
VKGYEAVMPRLRAVPWMIALDAAMIARDRWTRLEAHERRRLVEIARKGRGVTERDKTDLRRIVHKLELLDAGRQLLPIVGGRRKRRRR